MTFRAVTARCGRSLCAPHRCRAAVAPPERGESVGCLSPPRRESEGSAPSAPFPSPPERLEGGERAVRVVPVAAAPRERRKCADRAVPVAAAPPEHRAGAAEVKGSLASALSPSPPLQDSKESTPPEPTEQGTSPNLLTSIMSTY